MKKGLERLDDNNKQIEKGLAYSDLLIKRDGIDCL